jgi:hypothetical protein
MSAVGGTLLVITRGRDPSDPAGTIHTGVDLCRPDVVRSSAPVWARTSKSGRGFYVRMNNSRREMPDDELPTYLFDRWPD